MNKVFIIIINFCLILLMGGCSLINDETIDIDQIYKQKEEVYYIYFYKENCSYCDLVQEEIQLIESGDIKLYKVNLSLKNNTLIGRTHPSGHGKNNAYFVDGVTDYNQLYIAIAPTIIKIETIDGIKVSSYVAGGSSEIMDLF